MNRKPCTLFISDLHLDENQPKIIQLFLQFLRSLHPDQVDALYILGDLFEVWIGDDAITPWQQSITDALKKTTAEGVLVYFLPGNRDFLIGQQFLEASGCKAIADETIITINDTRVLLMHGDTLCTRDIAYLAARKKWRDSWRQHFFLVLPVWLRKKIALYFRNKSKKHTSNTQPDIMDVTQAEVESVMQKHQVNVMIHGHTHKPDIHAFTIEGRKVKRMVLGAWHKHGHQLIWTADGSQEMKIILPELSQ